MQDPSYLAGSDAPVLTDAEDNNEALKLSAWRKEEEGSSGQDSLENSDDKRGRSRKHKKDHNHNHNHSRHHHRHYEPNGKELEQKPLPGKLDKGPEKLLDGIHERGSHSLEHL